MGAGARVAMMLSQCSAASPNLRGVLGRFFTCRVAHGPLCPHGGKCFIWLFHSWVEQKRGKVYQLSEVTPLGVL